MVGSGKTYFVCNLLHGPSPIGKAILDNFSEYLPKFKKIIPHDYSHMQTAIVHMEEKGLTFDQAQIEAFYASKRG